MSHPAHAPLGASFALGNHVLARLGGPDLRMLEPLEHVRLRARSVLFEPGTVIKHIYFPASAVISVVHVDVGGAMPEIVHVGAEGMIEVSALLAAERARRRAVVQIAGDAYRVPLSSAAMAFTHSKDFQALTLRFAEALILQLSQNVLCKLSHSLEQQFCQRLLLYAHRTSGESLELTHEQIAEALGARRQSITETARKLQARQVIAYARGRISVLDRAGLERYACECYGVIRDAYQELGVAHQDQGPGSLLVRSS